MVHEGVGLLRLQPVACSVDVGDVRLREQTPNVCLLLRPDGVRQSATDKVRLSHERPTSVRERIYLLHVTLDAIQIYSPFTPGS